MALEFACAGRVELRVMAFQVRQRSITAGPKVSIFSGGMPGMERRASRVWGRWRTILSREVSARMKKVGRPAAVAWAARQVRRVSERACCVGVRGSGGGAGGVRVLVATVEMAGLVMADGAAGLSAAASKSDAFGRDDRVLVVGENAWG